MTRNTEEILESGFYFGCTDLCALVASVLIQNEYACKLIFTISEKYSEYKNIGHTYLFIENKGRSYLYDPAMSRQIIEGYHLNMPEIPVKSLIGNQLIYAVHESPGKMGMLIGDGELRLRRQAYAYWRPLLNMSEQAAIHLRSFSAIAGLRH